MLAELFNEIEKDGRRPSQLMITRAAFYSKDENEPHNPMAYGLLLMMPAVYRLWAECRLKRLQPWIAQWAHPSMYAGVEGKEVRMRLMRWRWRRNSPGSRRSITVEERPVYTSASFTLLGRW